MAYKAVRKDGSSVFNRHFTYAPNQTYEAHCDCNLDEENSFGLSAWAKPKAKKYYPGGKILKVKIAIKDIGAIVHKNQKIRCRKLTVLQETN